MKREFNVVYTPIEDEWIKAQVSELPGAVTQGRDMDEAREMIQEAVELLLQSYRENAVKVAPTGAVWETIGGRAGVMKRRDFVPITFDLHSLSPNL